MCGNLAFFGGVFVAVGYTFKSVWKLLRAVGGEDKPFLNNSFYVFLSAGFICLAFALWRSQRRVEAMRLSSVWMFPIVFVAVVWAVAGYVGFFTDSYAWFYILLSAAILANIVLLLQLIYRSLKPTPFWLAASLLIFNLIVVLSVAKNTNSSLSLQGINPIIVIFGQGSFAFASLLLAKRKQ